MLLLVIIQEKTKTTIIKTPWLTATSGWQLGYDKSLLAVAVLSVTYLLGTTACALRECWGPVRCQGRRLCSQRVAQLALQVRGTRACSQYKDIWVRKLPPQWGCWTLTRVDKLLSSAKERWCSPASLPCTAGAHTFHATLIKRLLSPVSQRFTSVLLLSISVLRAYFSD